MITQPYMGTASWKKGAVLTSSYASLVLRYYVILFSLLSCLVHLTYTAASLKLCHSCDFYLGSENNREFQRNLKSQANSSKVPYLQRLIY